MHCEGACAGRQSAMDSWARMQPASRMTASIGRMLTASSTWCAFAIFVQSWSSCLSPMHFHEYGYGPENLLATGSQQKLVDAQPFVTEAKSEKGGAY